MFDGTSHKVDDITTSSVRQVLQKLSHDIGTYFRDVRHNIGIHRRQRPCTQKVSGILFRGTVQVSTNGEKIRHVRQ